jgi:hypothetical protein
MQEALCKALVADAKLPADQSRLIRIAWETKDNNLRGFVNGVRSIPGLAFLEDVIEHDRERANVRRTRDESPQLAPAEIKNVPQPLAVERRQGLATLVPLQFRSQLEERIQAGIARVLTEAWEAVSAETAQEDRFKTARREAVEIISRLSPHVKRAVGAHFQTKNWEPLKERDPKL